MTQPSTLVLTLVGDDRPGIVGRLAALVDQHGGNWLESRMARLAGKFAGIAMFTLHADEVGTLRAACDGLRADGLTIHIEETGAHGQPEGTAWHLELVGTDRPGIVRQVTEALAAAGVNVEELHTELAEAPMAGGTLFQVYARLLLPPQVEPDQLRARLEAVGADLMVDLDLSQDD